MSPFPLPSSLERIGHRGAPRERPENTRSGFLLALERGADAVELDVHVTSDGVPVVYHDFDARGLPIASTTRARLADIDLGGGERIPELADVLRALGDRAVVYAELKGRNIGDAVLPVLRKHGHRYAVHSFDHAAIARCAQIAPDIPRGVLLDRDAERPLELLGAAVAASRPRDVWPHWSLVDERFMATARNLDLRVIAWTVNAPDAARRLLKLGVAGICTDDLRLLANL